MTLNGGPGSGPFIHKIPKSAWLWNLLQWRLDSWTESICLCTQNFAPGLPGFFGTGYEPDFGLDAWYLDAAGYDLLSGNGVQCFRGEDSFSTEYFFVPPQNIQTWCRKFGFASGNWDTENGQPTEFPAVQMNSQWLTPADILTALAPVLSPRSDTFLVRTYGEAINPATSAAEGRAWCEALVQRVPEYLDAVDAPEVSPIDLSSEINRTGGRRFKVISFRWLTRADI